MSRYLWLFLALITVLIGVLIIPLKNWFNNKVTCLEEGDLLFANDDLARYSGLEGSPGLYLAFLGIVYDVSKGKLYLQCKLKQV